MAALRTSLEHLLTSPAGFDLGTASRLQRALCRAADGLRVRPELIDDEALQRHFRCERSQIGLSTPVLVVIVAGVRGGKSLLAACAAVKGCMTGDLSALRKHEVPRFAIVAPTVDNATATFRLLVGHVQASPVLSRLVVKDPSDDTLLLRRPDGHVVEIVVVAAHRGAVTLRSRWLVGFVLDEVALFGAEATGAAINAEELLRAGETRLVPGAQGWIISSPFGPSGLLYDLWREHFGNPGAVLVVHAPTRALNPSFPQAKIDAVRRRNPDAAAREYDAEWIDADTAFFDGTLIDAATRATPLEEAPVPGAAYAAAWDAATRGNSWTLIVARAEAADVQPQLVGSTAEERPRQLLELPRVRIALARQWTGSKKSPLDPDATIAEIAGILATYGVKSVRCDSWGADALQALARRHGITLREVSSTQAEQFARYDAVRTLLTTSRLELAPHPVLATDLKGVRKKALANGIKPELPKTSDGRHCDFAPALTLACEAAPSALSDMRRPRGGGVWVQDDIWELRLDGSRPGHFVT
ncbi:MAG TPA: hypothetical protein VGG39_08850 [Polyangiaceae bacterium]|jgi:hypothetical protein